MIWAYLSSIALSAILIIQPFLNKRLYDQLAPSTITVVNNFLSFVFAFIYLVFYAILNRKHLVYFTTNLNQFSWWWCVPGLCGFFIVAGLPYCFAKLGAFKTTLILVSGQIIISLLLDYFANSIPLSYAKVAAAILGIASIFLAQL